MLHSEQKPVMPSQRIAMGARTTAVVATLIIVVGAIGVTSIYYIPSLRHSSSSGTTRTCTVVYGTDGFYSFYCPEHLRISGTNGLWNFTVSISADPMAPGQSILLVSN
jgi:hypothetical protein